jgi:hypothetical protein
MADVNAITCPKCSGCGKLLGMFPVYAEGVPAEKRRPVIELRCPPCDGTGMVSQERLRTMEIGREISALRRAAGVGLRESSNLLPMSPSDLSRIEQGLGAIGETIAIRDYWKYRDIPATR